MRRPAPRSLADIRHPGPKADQRRPLVRCSAEAVSFDLVGGNSLLTALGTWARTEGFASAVLDLGGLSVAAFDFVMPDRAIDDRHAAWYSDTHSSRGATLEEAVAILGWRDGDWFAHIHAFWHEDGRDHLGHLLPHTLSLASPAQVSGFGLKGAKFEADLDPETEFTLFRVKKDTASADAGRPNALITTLAPFEDLHDSVAALADTLEGDSFQVSGLGSFAGATFMDNAPMTGLISEILLRRGAGKQAASELRLPVRCIDLDGELRHGTVCPGKAPTLVTCELLLCEDDLKPQP